MSCIGHKKFYSVTSALRPSARKMAKTMPRTGPHLDPIDKLLNTFKLPLSNKSFFGNYSQLFHKI